MDSRTVKIYSTEDTPRLRYIAGIILGDILGLVWEVITDKRKLGKHPVINYSGGKISGSFKISPHALLFEKGVKRQEISVNEWNGLPAFFETTPDSDIPFDIFAASFYLISRYEEYLEYQPDKFGRFQASESIAFRNGFLLKPVVDLWVKELTRVFLRKFNSLAFKRCDYKALLTIDLDEPFDSQGKNLFGSIAGLFGNLKHGKNHNENNQGAESGELKNGENVFNYIFENIRSSKSDACFFIPVGDSSNYDKNPSWKNTDYRNLIHTITGSFKAGIHPSFNAAKNYPLLTREIGRLKLIIGTGITLSRFHYCRLFIPQSYRQLDKERISEDYSMGYPDEPGFRAGIARPFLFYDVINDQQTSLKIIPFQVMDETLVKYKKLDPGQAEEVILKLISDTRKVGGLFVSIWHNTTFPDNEAGKGWRNVFESMLKNQKQ